MNQLLINLLVTIVRQLVSAPLWAFISNAVKQADMVDTAGATKRNMVITRVVNTESFKTTAAWLVNLAIEVAVAKLRSGK